ncbi:hypothetical protein AVEN_21759-1 [Araneus ventricosus]|uniref:Uncharacterized protein n=1 Tax=Araneus ventricosus TaxID=182803 RepID=A0A4Y2BV40_ARAVE|nr:hypothetical protein AVEN_246399-1 [Araneus ventricosus]GBL96147.1 hypothetical protein AVEN_21759-1 [Araneus ventricosus]
MLNGSFKVILDISFDDQHQIICNRLYMNVISRNLIKYFVGYEIPQDHGMNLVGSLVFFLCGLTLWGQQCHFLIFKKAVKESMLIGRVLESKPLRIAPCSSRGGLVVRCRSWSRRVPGSKPDSTEYLSCIGPSAC